MCTIFNMHSCAPAKVLHAQNLVHKKKYNLWRSVVKENKLGILQIYTLCWKIQHRALGPVKSTDGITVFSIWKSLSVLQNACIKIMAHPIYAYLFFFLYIHSFVLLQNKKFLCRPSQILCTVTTMNITYMQTTLRKYENLCTVLIPLC